MASVKKKVLHSIEIKSYKFMGIVLIIAIAKCAWEKRIYTPNSSVLV